MLVDTFVLPASRGLRAAGIIHLVSAAAVYAVHTSTRDTSPAARGARRKTVTLFIHLGPFVSQLQQIL